MKNNIDLIDTINKFLYIQKPPKLMDFEKKYIVNEIARMEELNYPHTLLKILTLTDLYNLKDVSLLTLLNSAYEFYAILHFHKFGVNLNKKIKWEVMH